MRVLDMVDIGEDDKQLQRKLMKVLAYVLPVGDLDGEAAGIRSCAQAKDVRPIIQDP